MNKIPFMLIIGEKEAENNLLAVRQRSVGDLGTMTTNDFADLLNKTIKSELALND
jgi:threonyl-tRNA synthetase